MENNTPKRKPDWNPEKVADFLNEFTSKATIRLYRYHIKNFFKAIDKSPDEYIKDVRLMNPEERLRNLDRYEKDIKKYHHKLIEIGRSPTNITVAINTMRVFLKHHKIYLDDEIWKNIKRRGLGNKPVILVQKCICSSGTTSLQHLHLNAPEEILCVDIIDG